jgi:hypothetical protein
MKSKAAIDPDEPSLGRICADYITPPHMPGSIIQCIRRVESIPRRISAHLFADISCDTPLTEGHISILRSDGPGRGIDKPFAVVSEEYVESSLPEGMYAIKNPATNRFLRADHDPIRTCELIGEGVWSRSRFQVN